MDAANSPSAPDDTAAKAALASPGDSPAPAQAADSPARALDRFSEGVRGWFLETFSAPTPLQGLAWAAIAQAENVLVVAPTGSGKTLAAFLFAIDALMREKADRGDGGFGADDGARSGARCRI